MHRYYLSNAIPSGSPCESQEINAGDNDRRRILAYLKRQRVLVVVSFNGCREVSRNSDKQREREIRRANRSPSDLSKFLHRCPGTLRIKYPIKYPRAVDIIFTFNPRGGAFITSTKLKHSLTLAPRASLNSCADVFRKIHKSSGQSSLVTFRPRKYRGHIPRGGLPFRDSSSSPDVSGESIFYHCALSPPSECTLEACRV
jgi:hypothetical protein